MNKTNNKHNFRYDKETINIVAKALSNAFAKVDCDLRCFDWLNYNPDFYREQNTKKAA